MLIPLYKFGKWSGCQADIFKEDNGYYAYIYGGGYKPKATRFYKKLENLKDELKNRGFYLIKTYTGDDKMLDISKRKQMLKVTVEDIIAELEKFPKGTEVYCNGSELFFIHVHKDGTAITFDDSDLDEYYDED